MGERRQERMGGELSLWVVNTGGTTTYVAIEGGWNDVRRAMGNFDSGTGQCLAGPVAREEPWNKCIPLVIVPPRSWFYVTERLPDEKESESGLSFWRIPEHGEPEPDRRFGCYDPEEFEVEADGQHHVWHDRGESFSTGCGEGQVYAWQPEPEAPPLPAGPEDHPTELESAVDPHPEVDFECDGDIEEPGSHDCTGGGE